MNQRNWMGLSLYSEPELTDTGFQMDKLSRRKLLQATVRIVGSTMVASKGMAAQTLNKSAPVARVPEKPHPGYIDAHVHVWTSDIKKYPLARGYRREQMQPPNFPPEELLSHARPCGVERIVLIQMSYYGHDNSYMLDTMRRFPGAFSGVAVIDDAARPQDVMRRLARQGVRGFRIAPKSSPLDQWLDTPGMAAMWRCGSEENLSMCCLIDPDALPAVDRMCEKFPEAPVVIDHIARIKADSKRRDEQVKELCNLARHKLTSVKISAFYALSKIYLDLAPVIRRLLEAFGPERLMWATDCPFQVQDGHTYLDSIALIRDRLDFLSDSDRQWLLRKTAERVFFS
ncbi:MAG TPA: amidohydrolase family protein [Terriglobia bacterium]|nr:amidohydrolase family protein [Terriglobia bacterium]